MKILILTSADHLYANYILRQLILDDSFSKHSIIVYEQDSIIPKKSKLQGLLKYYKISGWKYVTAQMIKTYLFIILRFIVFLSNKRESIYFPYYKNNLRSFKKITTNGIKEPEVEANIHKIKPDIILSIYSKEIIPSSILKIPTRGSVNLHPAYLPFYRGVSPVFWALANNEKWMGTTLHYIDENIDTGSIIFRKKIPIQSYVSEHEAYLLCAIEGKKLIINFLKTLIDNPQKKIKTLGTREKGSYFSLPTKNTVDKF